MCFPSRYFGHKLEKTIFLLCVPPPIWGPKSCANRERRQQYLSFWSAKQHKTTCLLLTSKPKSSDFSILGVNEARKDHVRVALSLSMRPVPNQTQRFTLAIERSSHPQTQKSTLSSLSWLPSARAYLFRRLMGGLLSISSLQDERDKTEQSVPVTKFDTRQERQYPPRTHIPPTNRTSLRPFTPQASQQAATAGLPAGGGLDWRAGTGKHHPKVRQGRRPL